MRLWEKILAGIFLFFILLIVLFSALPLITQKIFIPYYARLISKTTEVNVDYKKVDFSFYSSFPYLKFHFDSLAITGKGQFYGDTLFVCKSATFVLNLNDLKSIKQRLSFYEIDLDSPRFILLYSKNGNANYFFMPETPGGTSSGFTFFFNKIYLNDAQAVYIDYLNNIKIIGKQIQAQVSNFTYSDNLAKFRASVFVSGFYYQYGKIWLVRNLTFTFAGNYLNVFPVGRSDYYFNVTAAINRYLIFNISGKFKNWNFIANKPYYDYSLKISNQSDDFRNLIGALPYFYQNKRVDFEAGGSYGINYEYVSKYFYKNGKKVDSDYVKSNFWVTDAWFHYAHFPDTLRNISLSGRYFKSKKTKIYLDYASCNLKDNYFFIDKFSLVKDKKNINIIGRLSSLFDLSKIREFVPIKFGLKGFMKLNLVLDGSFDYTKPQDFSGLFVNGKFSLKNFSFSGYNHKVNVRSLSSYFTPGQFNFEANSIRFDSSRFKHIVLGASGYLNYLLFKLNKKPTPSMEVNAVMVADTLDLPGLLNTSGAAVSTSQKRSLPTLPDLHFKLHLKANMLKNNYLNVYNYRLFMEYSPDTISVLNKGDILGAPATLWFAANLNKLNDLDIKFYSQISNFNISNLVKPGFIPNSQKDYLRNVKGELNFNVKGSLNYSFRREFDIKKLNATGRIVSSQIDLPPSSSLRKFSKLMGIKDFTNPQLEKLEVDFQMNRGVLRVLPSNFYINGLKSSIQGLYYFENNLLSLKLKMSLPPNLAFQTLHKAVTGGKNVSVVVKVYGPADNLKFSLGTDMFKREPKLVTPKIVDLSFNQDSTLAVAKARADSIIINAKIQAQRVLDSAKQVELEIYRQAYRDIDALRHSKKYKKNREKRIVKRALRRAKKIMRKAIVRHNKILRRAYRKADLVLRTAKRHNRKINRLIIKTSKHSATDTLNQR